MKKLNKKGFTIVELVIVIAVIAILAGVLIPTFASIINKANRSSADQEIRAALTVVLAEENAQMSDDAEYYFLYVLEDEVICFEYVDGKLVEAEEVELDNLDANDIVWYPANNINVVDEAEDEEGKKLIDSAIDTAAGVRTPLADLGANTVVVKVIDGSANSALAAAKEAYEADFDNAKTGEGENATITASKEAGDYNKITEDTAAVEGKKYYTGETGRQEATLTNEGEFVEGTIYYEANFTLKGSFEFVPAVVEDEENNVEPVDAYYIYTLELNGSTFVYTSNTQKWTITK